MVTAIEKQRGLLIIPAAIMSEVAHLVERDLGQRALAGLILDMVEGAFLLDYSPGSWPRILELVRRYADLPLRLEDSAVIECAERHGGRCSRWTGGILGLSNGSD